MPKINVIWIELDAPSGDDIASNHRQCELANKMLSRLGVNASTTFWYDEKQRVYCYGGDLGYKVLNDNGLWFHLDYLAGETTE